MPPDNRLNTGKGRSFQVSAAEILAAHFGIVFQLDYPIAIGRPPKLHRFDLASTDYYYRTYQHLLNGVFVIEIDIDTGSFREIGRTVA